MGARRAPPAFPPRGGKHWHCLCIELIAFSSFPPLGGKHCHCLCIDLIAFSWRVFFSPRWTFGKTLIVCAAARPPARPLARLPARRRAPSPAGTTARSTLGVGPDTRTLVL